MEVQSLSVCVPGGCPNNCKFCVSRMHTSPYINQIELNKPFRDLYENDFKRRLQFARDNGCNTIILTGEGEPVMNFHFLRDFAHWNSAIQSPFRWIEIQTSGVTIDDETLRFLRNTVLVNTISLSLSNVCNSESNREINGTPEKLKVDIDWLCHEIKRYDFNLRLSLNMTDVYENQWGTGAYCFNRLMEKAEELGANQVTFRKLYVSEEGLPQTKWIKEHGAHDALFKTINDEIRTRGKELEVLPFGAIRYSFKGISLVVDDDCMAKTVKPVMKYMILRPNCKLYTRWDDPGSLLF